MSVLTVLLSSDRSANRADAAAARTHGRWLWLLLSLFVLRVVAQPLSLILDAAVLPPFNAWYSGAVPYWILLPGQLLIVFSLSFVARSLTGGTVTPGRRQGVLLLVAGGIYFAVMLARLVLGATVLSHHLWFAKPLPTVFHLVLASALLVDGHFHARYGS